MPRDTVSLHAVVRRETRQALLERLGFEDYDDYLRSPHWRDVRRRYRESDLPQQCSMCGTAQFHLHHKTYERLGAEELTDFEPLCTECHGMVHALLRRGEFVNFQEFASWERAHQYAEETLPSRRRAQAEAPESLQARVAIAHKERSRARRNRPRRKLIQKLQKAGYLRRPDQPRVDVTHATDDDLAHRTFEP